jgi:hypothetical protein
MEDTYRSNLQAYESGTLEEGQKFHVGPSDASGITTRLGTDLGQLGGSAGFFELSDMVKAGHLDMGTVKALRNSKVLGLQGASARGKLGNVKLEQKHIDAIDSAIYKRNLAELTPYSAFSAAPKAVQHEVMQFKTHVRFMGDQVGRVLANPDSSIEDIAKAIEDSGKGDTNRRANTARAIRDQIIPNWEH